MSPGVQRKLTTILAADAAGYSRVMDADEIGGLAALQAARRVFVKAIELHRGRIANTAGDGLIAEFPSVVEAVQCAIDVQHELGARRDEGVALKFRIGIHLGDVLVDGDDLLGEGVNLAARLQSMAEPGGILISRQVYDQVHQKLSVGFEALGARRPRNFARDVQVYRVATGGEGPAIGGHESDGRVWRVPQRGEAHASAGDAPPARDAAAARWSSLARRAKVFGGVWLALLAVDLMTGAQLWAQWPGLAFATILGVEAAPLLARGVVDPQIARGAVIVAVLAAIITGAWSGIVWFVLPAVALLALWALVRRGGVRAR